MRIINIDTMNKYKPKDNINHVSFPIYAYLRGQRPF